MTDDGALLWCRPAPAGSLARVTRVVDTLAPRGFLEEWVLVVHKKKLRSFPACVGSSPPAHSAPLVARHAFLVSAACWCGFRLSDARTARTARVLKEEARSKAVGGHATGRSCGNSTARRLRDTSGHVPAKVVFRLCARAEAHFRRGTVISPARTLPCEFDPSRRLSGGTVIPETSAGLRCSASRENSWRSPFRDLRTGPWHG